MFSKSFSLRTPARLLLLIGIRRQYVMRRVLLSSFVPQRFSHCVAPERLWEKYKWLSNVLIMNSSDGLERYPPPPPSLGGEETTTTALDIVSLERERDREGKRESERGRKGYTERERDTERERETQRERGRERETDRDTQREREIQRVRRRREEERERARDRQKEKETDREKILLITQQCPASYATCRSLSLTPRAMRFPAVSMATSCSLRLQDAPSSPPSSPPAHCHDSG